MRIGLSRNAAVSWLVAVLLVAGWAVTLRPVALGGPAAFVGIDGISMQPTMYQGDMAITRRHHTYRQGEVIAYHVPKGQAGEGNNVIHRIVGGNGRTGYTTQGDNNSYTDVWHPTDHDVIGKVWIKAPNAAGWLSHLRSPGTLALVVGIVTFVVMVLPDRKKKGPADDGDATAEPEPDPDPEPVSVG